MPRRDDVGRREFNKTTAAAAIGAFTGTLGTAGVAVNSILSDDDSEETEVTREPEIRRGSYDREELQELASCYEDGSGDLRGLTRDLDVMLDPDAEGRTLERIDYEANLDGDPESAGSSFRYWAILDGGNEEGEFGRYVTENENVRLLAEADKMLEEGKIDSLGEYAEEHCQ